MSVSEMPVSTAPAGPGGTSPRPFSEIPSLWVKVTQMSKEFMAEEVPRASGLTTFIGVVIAAVITAIITALAAMIGGGALLGQVPAQERAAFVAMGGGIVMASIVLGLIAGPVGFYLGNALTYIGARVLGGTGSFTSQAYLISLFYVPLGIVISVLNVIPTVGQIIVIVPSIFMFVLNVRAIKVAHRLGTGQAIAAMLWPVVLVAVVCCGVLLLIGPIVGNVFSNVIQNLQTPTP